MVAPNFLIDYPIIWKTQEKFLGDEYGLFEKTTTEKCFLRQNSQKIFLGAEKCEKMIVISADVKFFEKIVHKIAQGLK